MTYNKYLTEGIQDDTIKEITRNGVCVYLVRRPKSNEEVMGYTNFSGITVNKTLTEAAKCDTQK